MNFEDLLQLGGTTENGKHVGGEMEALPIWGIFRFKNTDIIH